MAKALGFCPAVNGEPETGVNAPVSNGRFAYAANYVSHDVSASMLNAETSWET